MRERIRDIPSWAIRLRIDEVRSRLGCPDDPAVSYAAAALAIGAAIWTQDTSLSSNAGVAVLTTADRVDRLDG